MRRRWPGWVVLLGLGCAAALVSCTPRTVSSLPEGLTLVPGGTASLGSAASPAQGGPRETRVETFALARHEVTVAAYCRYLDASSADPDVEHPQILRRGGQYVPAAGHHDKAVAWIAFDDAQAYCRWLSGTLDRTCRLPTADEWEFAAQPGVPGAPYPWGWGDPHGRSAFDLEAPLRVGLFPPNGLGLHDLAGGVAEWCVGKGDADDNHTVKGGSWAERDPGQVTVFGGDRLPSIYRDADVGFRIAADVKGAVVASTQAYR